MNSAEVYYDPTKLKFSFSTPSPLSRKFLEMRDRTAASDDSGELAPPIYDMADVPLSTGSVGARPTLAAPHGEDRQVITYQSIVAVLAS